MITAYDMYKKGYSEGNLSELKTKEIPKTIEPRKKSRNLRMRFNKTQIKILLYASDQFRGFIISQTDLAKQWKMPITSLNHHFKKLKENGYLSEQSELTEKGNNVLRFIKRWDKLCDSNLRAHRIQVTFNLLRAPDSLKNNTFSEPFTNGRYLGLSSELIGCSLHYYGVKKLVALLPEIYADSDESLSGSIQLIVSNLKNALKLEYPKIVFDSEKVAVLTDLHIAIFDSVVSEYYYLSHPSGHTLRDGIAVDQSHGRYEFEAEGVDALKDISWLINVEKLKKENEELKKIINELKVSQNFTSAPMQQKQQKMQFF